MKSAIKNLICVTNRHICKEDLFIRVEKIVKHKPRGILLREKDLTEDEYEIIAKDILKICLKEDVQLIAHNFVDTALKLNIGSMHLTFSALRAMNAEDKSKFKFLGASCHSVEEARKSEMAGCNRVIAGRLFDTLNKRPFEPNDIDFFKDAVRNLTIPVFAIGGINPSNLAQVMNTGVIGACVMSGPMLCDDVDSYLKGLVY